MPRSREFDPEQALQEVMNTFWEKGYDGTSLQDLEAATGLKKQSLYRLYGDKHGMYLASLQAYAQEIKAALDGMATVGDAYEKIASLLQIPIELTREGDRRGCLICNAAVDKAPACEQVSALVQSSVLRFTRVVMESIADLPGYESDEHARRRMARKIHAVYFGMRVMVKAGMPEDVLQDIREATLAELPTSPTSDESPNA